MSRWILRGPAVVRARAARGSHKPAPTWSVSCSSRPTLSSSLRAAAETPACRQITLSSDASSAVTDVRLRYGSLSPTKAMWWPNSRKCASGSRSGWMTAASLLVSVTVG